MNAAGIYANKILERLGTMITSQQDQLAAAASVVADAIGAGHRVWIAETTHCLHDKGTARAGGLMAVHKLTDPIGIEAGDIVLIGTNAGTTELTVELVLIARERNAVSIALTQLAYELDLRLLPEHPSGQRLAQVADIVIDLGGRYGDTELDFTAGDRVFSAIPGSGVAAMTAMWMIFAGATELLCERGTPPLIWDSMQMPGVHSANLERYARYRHSRQGIEG